MMVEVKQRQVLFLILATAGVVVGDWSHKDLQQWPSQFQACGGGSQSPIDIVDRHTKHDPSLGGLEFTNYDNRLATKQQVLNNGFSLQVNVEGDASISGGGLPGKYKLAQYHFHWGDSVDKLTGAEHTNNGFTYPAELHLVHYNTNYSNIGEAIDKPGGLAVLGIWIKTGRLHEPLQELLQYVSDVRSKPKGDSQLLAAPIRLLDLLPGNTDSYYRYSGSLTTPPCFESVVWTMFRQPIQVAYSQILQFQELQTPGGGSIVNNYRPVQALNGREVRSSVKVHRETKDLITFTSVSGVAVIVVILFTMVKYSKKHKSGTKTE